MNEPGSNVDPITQDLADDESVLSSLKAEERFFKAIIVATKVLGLTAVGSSLAMLSTELQQTQGIPAGRAAYVVAALGAAISLGTSAVLDEKASGAAFQISQVENNIRAREAYLFAQIEFGGPSACVGPRFS